MLRTMAVLIGLLNLTLTAATGSSGGSRPPGPSGSACWSRPGCTSPELLGRVGSTNLFIVSAATWRVFDRATVAQAYQVPYT
jgi:hypothetical protein